jgi:trk system potassium uptake protein
MNFRAIGAVIGFLLMFCGVAMSLGIPFSIYYRSGDAGVLSLTAAGSFIIGFVFYSVYRKHRHDMKLREGVFVVATGWIILSTIGAIPFLMYGIFDTFTDAFFEMISGFTTTSATTLASIETLPHGLLFWRSIAHWIGGMGMIVLSLSILPMLGIGGMQMYHAEVPGPTPDKLSPRIKQTAVLLWTVYTAVSGVLTVLLMFGGMNLFDALCHTFGTMGTGGCSTRDAGLAYYDSGYINSVVTIFMIIAGMNIAVQYRILRGEVSLLWTGSEIRFYLGFLFVMSLIVIGYRGIGGTVVDGDMISDSVFHVVSVATTTAYANSDFSAWGPMMIFVFFLLMFTGACAGSTSGAMKSIRILVLFKAAAAEIKRLVHPRAVIPVRINKRALSPDIIGRIFSFFMVYLASFIIASFVMMLIGLSMYDAFGAVAAMLGNIGLGFAGDTVTGNYAHIPVLGKWVLSFCMVLGRLEFFTLLLIVTPTFWKK